jgi:arylsulfatase A-like enzyme
VDEPREATDDLRCLLGMRPCSEADWAVFRALYRAEVENLDLGMARLLAALDRTGRGDDTLLIFLSDHGEGFDLERNRLHHGGRLHEDQIRIPLLIHGPDIAPGNIETPISLVDVMPTLLDLLGLPSPEGLDGRTFAPVIRRGAMLAEVPLYAMEHYHLWDREGRKNAPAVQTAPLSVAVILGSDWYIAGPFEEELYDMSADPKQERDLSADGSRVDRLRGLSASRPRVRIQRAPSEHDPELIERLRELGYVE